VGGASPPYGQPGERPEQSHEKYVLTIVVITSNIWL
jgi:hypothetical protein